MNFFISFIGIMIPFLGTTLGSSSVFFLKNKLSDKMSKVLNGIAAGVMVAASIWSLIIPATEFLEGSKIKICFGISIAFIIGIIFLIFSDKFLERLENKKYKNLLMIILAVTLHNFPEGMAVGSSFASDNFTGAMLLSIGIAIQNIPEGAIISMPILAAGGEKKKAFLIGVLSGIVEPIGAFLTLAITKHMTGILPYVLSFAAGNMIYVVLEELVPEAKDKKKIGTIGFAIGFLIMMSLDIIFGKN